MKRITMILLTLTTSLLAKDYHFCSRSGNDAHDGSAAAPLRSLEQANRIVLRPGDRMLFRNGSVYDGHFQPQGEGTREAPITIGRYGDKNAPRPRFNGQGMFEEAVLIYNTRYLHLDGLEITNTGPQRKPKRRGLKIQIENYGTAQDIRVSNLYIHDVNGSIVKREGGGSAIVWQNGGKEVKSRFDGLLIENCLLEDCTRNGINSRGYTNRADWYPNLNVVVRGNTLVGIPGDGIVPIGCDGAIIEHNRMKDCPRMLLKGDAAAGIWPWSSDNTIIQFNEVSDHKACWDGQGFDSDWNCNGTVIQYNFSHDNEGGFLLVCCNGKAAPAMAINNDTVVRYNISINDGLRTVGHAAGFSPIFHISGPVRNTRIYNNLIFVPKKPDPAIDRTIIKMDNWGGPWPNTTFFANNIVVVSEEADFDWGKSQANHFTNNVYYGDFVNLPGDPQAIRVDPRFVGPLDRGADGGWRPDAFRLAFDSPCIESGIVIPDNGGRDYSGESLGDKVNIGPFE
jgi:hypothetical protein